MYNSSVESFTLNKIPDKFRQSISTLNNCCVSTLRIHCYTATLLRIVTHCYTLLHAAPSTHYLHTVTPLHCYTVIHCYTMLHQQTTYTLLRRYTITHSYTLSHTVTHCTISTLLTHCYIATPLHIVTHCHALLHTAPSAHYLHTFTLLHRYT